MNGEVLLEKRDNTLYSKLYFKILRNVLVYNNNEFNFNNCYRPSQTLYSSNRYSLCHVSFSIFVYVGTLSLHVHPHMFKDKDIHIFIHVKNSVLMGWNLVPLQELCHVSVLLLKEAFQEICW